MRKQAAAWACHPSELSGQLEIQALDQTAGFLRDDPIGVASLWDTVGRLADEPRPPESFAYGSPNLRRLRAVRYRVFTRSIKNSC
jgi:mRNA interferase RelE/StbE